MSPLPDPNDHNDPQNEIDRFYDLFAEPPETLRPLFYASHHHRQLLPALYEWLDGWEEHYTINPEELSVRIRGRRTVRTLISPSYLTAYQPLLTELIALLGEETSSVHPVYRTQLHDHFLVSF